MHKLKITKRYLLIILISCLLLLISGAIMLSYTTYDSHAAALELYGEIKSGKGTLSLSAKGGNVDWSATATENSDCGHNDLDPSGAWLGSDDVRISASLTAATGYHVRALEIPEDGGYMDGTTYRSWIVNISRPSTTNVVRHVYGYFDRNTYNIIYNLNGGSKSSTYNYYPTSATYDSAFNVGNPTKTGYSFKGWTGSGINTSTAKYGSTKNVATNSWTNSNTVVYYGSYMGFNNLTSSNGGYVTLIANWTANTYTINLDKQSGSGGTSTIYLKYNTGWYSNSGATSSISTISKPTMTGYTFQGYYTEKSGNGTKIIDSTGKIVGSNTYIAESDTLYAYWTPKIYTINLNKQSGSNGTITIYLKYNTGWYSNSAGTTSISAITKPTRTGYIFQGYYTDTEGKGTQIINSNGNFVSGKLTYTTANDTLYAYWIPISYSINFNLGNGSWSGSSPTNNTQYDTVLNIPNPRPPTGYTFSGWTASGTNFNSTTARRGTSSSSCNTTWNGTTKTKNTYFKNLSSTNSGKVTMTANYTANSYTVRFNPNGGSVSPTTKSVTYDSTYGTLPTPTRTGYTFTGWTLNGATITSTTQVKTASNHTLIAQWKADSYTLTFDPNGQGGTVSPTTKTVTYDSTYGDLPIPTRAGYIFIGWYTDKSAGSQVLSNTTVKTAKNHSIYAHWQATWATQATKPELRVPSNPNNASNPYIIDTPGKLAWLAMQAQTKNLSGYYEQTKNIELDDYIWLPIGTNTYSFTGYYDGKGYTIEGLHTAETTEVSNSTSVNSYVGLFGRTNGAKLNNIYVKEAKIYGHTNVGGIVGYAKGSTVLTSCGFSGTISAQANSGALIGNSASGVQITDCIVFSANVDKLNSGSANTTNTISVLNGKKGYSSGEFTNWVYVSGMPYPVPKGLSWLANGGSPASKTDIENWAKN